MLCIPDEVWIHNILPRLETEDLIAWSSVNKKSLNLARLCVPIPPTHISNFECLPKVLPLLRASWPNLHVAVCGDATNFDKISTEVLCLATSVTLQGALVLLTELVLSETCSQGRRF